MGTTRRAPARRWASNWLDAVAGRELVPLAEALPEHAVLLAFCSGGSEARWKDVYSFLSTLHSRIAELEPNYRPGGWSYSKKWHYYGYRFSIGAAKTASWWIGFAAADGATTLALYKNEERVLPSLPLVAEEAANAIVAAVKEA